MIEVTDAIDRQIRIARPPARVVSLVPSETLSVAELAGIDRIVGRTDYCVEPAGTIEAVPSVGGTKGFDVDAVKALRPDLVLANKEENSRPLVASLIDAGLTVHVSFPCSVDQSQAYLETLCRLLGVDANEAPALRACREAAVRSERLDASELLPVFVPIWKDPWMTFDDRAFASDVLRRCGAWNVFAGRVRRYPLAADLRREGSREVRAGDRDTRYPRIRLSEIIERGARAVLLPDEPYAFADVDVAEIQALRPESPLVVQYVDGKDLFWYGTHVARALVRLTAEVKRVREQIGLGAHN